LAVLRELLALWGLEKLTGVVIPKVTSKNVQEYLDLLKNTHLKVMLTLETAETFDRHDNERLV
jgi:citrate lyase beta subunit